MSYDPIMMDKLSIDQSSSSSNSFPSNSQSSVSVGDTSSFLLSLPSPILYYILELLFDSYKTYTPYSFLKLATVCTAFRVNVERIGISCITVYRPTLLGKLFTFVKNLQHHRIHCVVELFVDFSESEWRGMETSETVMTLWNILPNLKRIGAKGFDSHNLQIPSTLQDLESLTLSYRYGKDLPSLYDLIPISNRHRKLKYLTLKYVQLTTGELARFEALDVMVLESCFIEGFEGTTISGTPSNNSHPSSNSNSIPNSNRPSAATSVPHHDSQPTLSPHSNSNGTDFDENDRHNLSSLTLLGDFPFTSLDMSYPFFMTMPNLLHLHWNITNIPPSRFKSIFALLPNLLSAELWWCTAMEVPTSGDLYMCLSPTLRNLKLCYPPPSSLRKALRAGLLKELTTLTVLHQRQEEDWEEEMEELCEIRKIDFVRLPYRLPW